MVVLGLVRLVIYLHMLEAKYSIHNKESMKEFVWLPAYVVMVKSMVMRYVMMAIMITLMGVTSYAKMETSKRS